MSIDNSHQPTAVSAELEALISKVVQATITQIEAGNVLSPFIRSKECAHLIEVAPETLCAMRARGEGPPWSGEGKWVRYERAAVIDWLRNLPRQPTTPALATSSQDRRSDSG